MKCFGCRAAAHKQNLWDPNQGSNKKDVLCFMFSNKEVISALQGRIQRSNLRHLREGAQRDTLLFSKLQFKSQEQTLHCNCSQHKLPS